ncbi:MAG: sel1 repeat family protein [Akkermansia sp.]|nr:sel1 repeat family protein [Akkermansia sp.]
MRLLPTIALGLISALVLTPVALAASAKKSGRKTSTQRSTTGRKPSSKSTTAKTTKTIAPAANKVVSEAPAKIDVKPLSPEMAEKYKLFLEKLDEQAKNDSLDYCPALQIVLDTTGDEWAALEWMQHAANEGYAAAQSYVSGRVLSHVPGDKLQDPATIQAYRLAKAAADKGYDPAGVDVSICLRHGIGTTKNEAAANAQLLQACKGGSFETRFKWLQLTGRLNKFDDKDRPEVKSEIDRGNHHIMYYLSSYAPDSPTQVEWLRKAAEQGNAEALFTLSSLSSRIKPKDSYVLLQEAVKLHSPAAMFVLGTALADPDPNNKFTQEAGIAKDEKTGIHLVRLAAMIGNSQSNMALGHAYYDGTFGLPKDAEKAYRHYAAARNARNIAGAAAEGYLLLKGEGVKQDTTRGTSLLNLAANAGYAHACVLLAHAEYAGFDGSPDASKAEEYLNDAAVRKMPEAYVFLAYITAKGGTNLKANPQLAENYVRMASLDMGDKAQQLYDKLMSEGKWEPHP